MEPRRAAATFASVLAAVVLAVGCGSAEEATPATSAINTTAPATTTPTTAATTTTVAIPTTTQPPVTASIYRIDFQLRSQLLEAARAMTDCSSPCSDQLGPWGDARAELMRQYGTKREGYDLMRQLDYELQAAGAALEVCASGPFERGCADAVAAWQEEIRGVAAEISRLP